MKGIKKAIIAQARTPQPQHCLVGSRMLAICSLVGLLVPLCGLGGSALAAGDASFSLSPSGGSYKVGSTITLTISENSTGGDDVNAVQANLSYNSALLTYKSTSLGAFDLCGQNTGGGGGVKIGCASTSIMNGTQTVARVTFTVAAIGSTTVAMTSGSDIASNTGTSVWNNVLPSAGYMLISSTRLCDGKGDCVSAHYWNVDSAVITSKSTTETLYTTPAKICDGGLGSKVGPKCPFITSSSFGTKFKGDYIVRIPWGSHSTCLGITASDLVVSANCQTGSGVLWVKAGSGVFVNRLATNKTGKEMVMTAPAAVGGKINVSQYTASNTAQEWVFKG